MKITALVVASLASAGAFVPHQSSPSFGVTSSFSNANKRFVSPLHATVVPNGGSASTATAPSTTIAAVPKVAQRWRKSTKQVVTLGPASSSKEMIEKLFLAGADVFRLNFSHGAQEQKKELLMLIREVEEKYSHPIAVLGDLQGPKLRVSCKLLLVLLLA